MKNSDTENKGKSNITPFDPYVVVLDGTLAIVVIRRLVALKLVDSITNDDEMDPVRKIMFITVLDEMGYACDKCGHPMDEEMAAEKCKECGS